MPKADSLWRARIKKEFINYKSQITNHKQITKPKDRNKKKRTKRFDESEVIF